MNKCNLCKKNDADKKGSHIVPHFLLKRIENIENKTERDYEIGYKIHGLKIKSHFGRSVKPEVLNEVYGEITDDDIANNKHPLVVDNFLCSKCEERLSLIESKYSQTIETVKNVDYESGINTLNGILFWASIFWRMSVYEEISVELNEEQNESLRDMLDSFLPKKNEELNEETFASSNLVKEVSYKIIRCHNVEKDDAKWLIFHPNFHDSFCLFIDEFVIVFSLDGKFEEFETTDCFGISDLILNAPTNNSIGNEIIQPFDRSIFLEYGKKIVDNITDNYLKQLEVFLDKVHVLAGGKGDKMPIEIKKEIIADIILNEKKSGRKFTKKEIIESTCKIMRKFIS